MTMTKKLVLTALCAAVVMLLSGRVLAASDEVKVRSLEMSTEILTVRVNQERTLFVVVYPYNAENRTIDWSSSNEEIAMVGGDGVVTGISPGTCTITATSHNGRTATCTVTVPGTVLSGIEQDTKNSDNAGAYASSGDRLTAYTLKLDVEQAIGSTPNNETASVAYTDKTTVSTAALRSAAYTAKAGGGNVAVKFQTTDADGKIQGQLTVYPERTGNEDADLSVEVVTDASKTAHTQSQAVAKFGSRVEVIKLAQSGDYGMEVRVAARSQIPSGSSVTLYRYSGGSFTELDASNTKADGNWLYFTTNLGGTIVAVYS